MTRRVYQCPYYKEIGICGHSHLTQHEQPYYEDQLYITPAYNDCRLSPIVRKDNDTCVCYIDVDMTFKDSDSAIRNLGASFEFRKPDGVGSVGERMSVLFASRGNTKAGPCDKVCDNKTALGYCRTTACIKPADEEKT